MSTVGSTTSAANAGPVTSALAGASGPSGGDMGKDAFLKILVAQLKNQDPESPMDGKEMSAQLAQFSSLEQLMQLNATLAAQDASQAAMAEAMQHAAAVNSIGKQVVAVGDGVAVDADGKGAVTVAVGGTGRATLSILDAQGNVVGTRDVGTLGPGRRTIELGDAAKGLPPGAYHYKLDVTGADGTAVPVTRFMTGRVDGVQAGPNGPVVKLGPLSVLFSNVAEITN